jgi:hypothetical protein
MDSQVGKPVFPTVPATTAEILEDEAVKLAKQLIDKALQNKAGRDDGEFQAQINIKLYRSQPLELKKRVEELLVEQLDEQGIVPFILLYRMHDPSGLYAVEANITMFAQIPPD